MTKLEFQIQAGSISGVRGRIVTGAIGIVVIGVAAFWHSNYVQRRENSIAYHKAEYLAARDGRPIMNDLRELWGRITGRQHRHRIHGEKLEVHGDALVRLGYWREETQPTNAQLSGLPNALDIRKATILKTT